MATTPATGQISMANLRDVYGVTTLGNLRNRHPVSTSTGCGVVSLGGMRATGNTMTGWFDASSFTGNTWLDMSSSRTVANVFRGTTTAAANVAASNGVPAIAGSTGDGLRFASTLLPTGANYTLFHMTRHAGANRGRIFDAVTGNWLSGFHANKSGVALHGAWSTPEVDVHGNSWVQSTDQWTSYRSNRVERVTIPPGTAANFQMSINAGANVANEASQWQCAEVVAFNRLLGNVEIAKVESYLADKYYTAIPRDPFVIMHAKDASATAGQANVAVWGATNKTEVTPTVGGGAVFNTVPAAVVSGDGGPNGGPCILSGHSFNNGPKTLNINTNGGWTVIAVVRFRGSTGSQQVFNFIGGPIVWRPSDPRLFGGPGAFGSPVVPEEWATWTYRYVTATFTTTVHKNGVQVATGTHGFNFDRRYDFIYTSPGDVSRVMLYDRALTDAEMILAAGSGIPPPGPQIFVDAADFTMTKSSPILSNVTSWSGFTANGIPQLVNPYPIVPSPHYLALDRVFSQYLDAGPRPYTLTSNGGCTVAIYARFPGAVNSGECLVNFNSGPGIDDITLGRVGASADMVFGTRTGTGTFYGAYANSQIVQNQWAVWVGRYTTSSSTIQLWKNNVTVGSLASVPLQANKTVANTWLGRFENTFATADISSFAAFDRSLTDAELTTVYTAMVSGTVDLPANGNLPRVQITPPSYIHFASYKPPSYVSFLRTLSQSASGGTRTFACGTNGGFTALARVRFTGNATTDERVFDFGAGVPDVSDIALARSGITGNLTFVSNSIAVTSTTSTPVTQAEWATYTCQLTNSTGQAQITKNNVVVATATGIVPLTDRTLTSTVVGNANIDVQSFVVYDRSLTAAELTQAHTFLLTGQGAVPVNPVINLVSAGPMPDLSVTNWAGWTTTGSPAPRLTSGYSTMLGTFAPLGTHLPAVPRSGYMRTPYVDLVRASAHSYNGGQRTFAIQQNGGFTAMAHVRFNGAPTAGERIFEFGNAASNNNIVFSRAAADPSLTFSIYAPTEFAVTVAANANVIVQNQWITLGCRYTASNNFMQIFDDGLPIASGPGPVSANVGNRTVSNTLIGRSLFGDPTSNMSIRSFVAYDRALSDAEMTTAHGYMVHNTGSLPASANIHLDAASLLTGTSLTTWGSFAVVGTATAIPSGGYDGGPYVVINRLAGSFSGGTRTFNLTQGLTIVIHQRSNNTNPENFISFGRAGDSSSIYAGRNPNPNGTINFGITGTPNVEITSGSIGMPLGEWSVVALMWDPVARVLRIYKNNVIVATSAVVTGGFLDRTLTSTAVGANSGGDFRFIGVYDRALSTSELTSAFTLLTTGAGSLPGPPMMMATTSSLSAQVTQTPTFRSSGNPQAYHTGGFNNGPYVRLDRSVPTFFTSGTQNLNTLTNRGFTAIVMMKFRGTTGNYERILDGGAPLWFARFSTGGTLGFAFNGGSVISSACIIQDEWAAFACRYSADTAIMHIFKNDTIVGTTTSVSATAAKDLNLTYMFVGRSSFAQDAYTNADMKCVLMYDRALTDAEMTQAYQYCTYDSPAPPIAPMAVLHAKDLVLDANKGSLPSWPTFGTAGAIFQSGTTPGPRVSPRGGFGDRGFVTFERLKSQFLFSPTSLALPITTNGGFTAISQLRFTNAIAGNERIFDFSVVASPATNITLYRDAASPSTCVIEVGNGSASTQLVSPSGNVTVNEWAVFACRYTASSTTLQLFKNNVIIATSATAPVMQNLTLDRAWVGRSRSGGDSYLAADMRFFGVYDRALSDEEMTSTHAYISDIS